MKKILMVLAFAGFSIAGFAQDEVPTKKYSVATNSFWSNWFLQVGADWNAWYSGQEHGEDLKVNPFKDFRSNPGVAVAIGKWFTPGLGLRIKAQGIWGKRVSNTDTHLATVDNGNKYWIAQGQAMFNLTNMFLGYSENRLVDIIPFVGAGVGRTMSHNLYATGLSAGLQASFRLSKLLRVYGEAGWNRYEGDIDGFDQYYGNRGWDSHDNNLYVELGLQINLGKSGWEKTPDIDALNAQHQAALDALNSRLRDAEAENARLREALANQKPVETISESVKELISTPISVFFDLNKINIASQKDLVNVRALAKYAVSNNSNLLVTGYADSATGTPKRNQWLSEQRAKTLADELVNMGIDSNKITQVGKGGVETLTPISFNRRATVQVTD